LYWKLLDVTSTPRYLLPAGILIFRVASITKKARSKYWFACFRDLQGKQRRLSTKQTDRKKAMKVAEQ